jgi:Bacitracin resistance protein BacA
MSYLQALVIALVQGVTELFPVSSLGHSVIVPAWMGGDWNTLVTQSAQANSDSSFYMAFVVALHVSTALALLWFFRADWIRIVAGFARSARRSVSARSFSARVRRAAGLADRNSDDSRRGDGAAVGAHFPHASREASIREHLLGHQRPHPAGRRPRAPAHGGVRRRPREAARADADRPRSASPRRGGRRAQLRARRRALGRGARRSVCVGCAHLTASIPRRSAGRGWCRCSR